MHKQGCCPACNGYKRITGLGGLERNCKTCNGTGKPPQSAPKQPDITKQPAPIKKAAKNG